MSKMVIWPTLKPSSRHHRVATGEMSGLIDSRYVGDNHELKIGQNGLVTEREIESEGDPLEEGHRFDFLFWSVQFNTYICVCIFLYGREERKKKKERKKQGKREKKKIRELSLF